MTFWIGVTYWPRRKGADLWSRFDRAEVAEELAQIAAIGCNAVRVPLTWSDVQPTADRLEHRVLDRLGRLLDLAEDVGLRVLVDLLVGRAHGAFYLPDWTMDFLPLLRGMLDATPPVLQIVNRHVEDRYWLRDPFEDEKLIAAEQRLYREVIGFFADHPAVLGWGLGDELDRARPPRDSDVVLEWLSRRVTEIQEVAEGAPLCWHSDLGALWRPASPRWPDLAETLPIQAVTVSPAFHALAEHPLDDELVRFAVALMRAASSDRPIWLTQCLIPTVPTPGDPGAMMAEPDTGREVYLASESEQAELVEKLLDGLWRDGVEGVWLGHYADFEEPLWEEPPLDRRPWARTAGLVRRTGVEKPAVAVLQRWRERLTGEQEASREPERVLDVDWREVRSDPDRHLRRLYDEFRQGGHG